MSFWNLNNGETITKETKMESADFVPIPDKTIVTAILTEIKNDYFDGESGIDEYINARWDITAPAEYKGRVVFQKMRPMSDKASQSDRAKLMLFAMHNEAGVQLPNRMPDDNDLAKLFMIKFNLRLRVWDMNGKQGNWVEELIETKKNSGTATQVAPQQAQAQAQGAASHDQIDEDIPF